MIMLSDAAETKPHSQARLADFQIVWVTNFYDIPLSGIAKHEGQWVAFAEIGDDLDDPLYELRRLGRMELVRRLFDKKLFEICVGNHWSYSDGERVSSFYWRRPRWLSNLLFKLYYRFAA